MVAAFALTAGLRHEGILGARLEHHVGAPPRLIVDQAPFVAGAEMVFGEQDIAGPDDERLAAAGREFERSRQRNDVLRLRSLCQSNEECAGVSLKWMATTSVRAFSSIVPSSTCDALSGPVYSLNARTI
jgi:hypothetical protein